MPEESEAGRQQQQGSPELAPLLVSVAAAAVAGALAVVARKMMSGDAGAGPKTGSDESGSDDGATSFDDLEQVADDLAALVEEFRSESAGRDFKRLSEILDTLSEYADQAADAFTASAGDGDSDQGGSERRVTEELMNRIGEITGRRKEKGSSRESGEKSRAA